MKVPKKFEDRYRDLSGDFDAFIESLSKFPSKSFRVNTIKASRDKVVRAFKEHKIEIHGLEWYEDAFTTEPKASLTIEHFLGQIYFQDLSSIIPPLLARSELSQAQRVLDMSAAPGSKTTQIAALMGNQGLLVANDIDYSRTKALKFNIEKSGALNTVITNFDARHIPNEKFDVIFADVPCSLEGTIQKNYKVLRSWSEKKIHRFSRLQRGIVEKGFELLVPGGVMIYSTCTFAPEENEEIINWLIEKHGCTIEKAEISGLDASSGITSWNGIEFSSELKKTLRIWPHKNNNMEGFFAAKVRK